MVGYNRQRSGDASLAAADSLALPIDKEFDEEGALSDEGDGGKYKDVATKKIVTRRIVLCFSSVVLVGIIALSIILVRMKGDGLGKSTDKLEGDNIFLSSPSDIYALLEPRVHNPKALLDMDTPEGRAFNVLLNETETESSMVLRPGFYTQRYALLALYFGTNGENWTNSTGWSDQSDAYEEWHGVHSEDSVVVGIDLGEIIRIFLFDATL